MAGNNGPRSDGSSANLSDRGTEMPTTGPQPWPKPPTPPESPKLSRLSTMSQPNPTGSRADTPKLRLNTGSQAKSAPTTAGRANVQSQSTTGSSSSDSTSLAISHLVGTMQKTLTALGSTFRVLGAQTMSVATLGPAVDAVLKLESLESVVRAHCLEQGKVVKDERDGAKERVKDYIRMKLRPQIDRIVGEVVSKEIEGRVRKELEAQVSPELKEILKEYRERILAAKIELANREARRRNAHIRGGALAEPLRPLLRPQNSPNATESDANADGAGVEPKGKESKEESKGKKSKQNTGATKPHRSVSATLLGGAVGEGSAGTPSPLFPKTVHALPSLDVHVARRLLLEYQIPVPADDAAADDGDWEDLGEDDGDDGKDATKNTKDSSKNAKDGKSAADRGGHGKGGGPNKSGQLENARGKAEREKKEKEENERREAKIKAREMRRGATDLNAFLQFVGWGAPGVRISPPT
ncbi:hypothetical protein C8Q79DRAFT_764085 [Trametes meyenii]|nr:hypothetical protein C8Q79DRAFT_764085 [Trametes meyenii]